MRGPRLISLRQILASVQCSRGTLEWGGHPAPRRLNRAEQMPKTVGHLFGPFCRGSIGLLTPMTPPPATTRAPPHLNGEEEIF